jgi:hypothetical protein
MKGWSMHWCWPEGPLYERVGGTRSQQRPASAGWLQVHRPHPPGPLHAQPSLPQPSTIMPACTRRSLLLYYIPLQAMQDDAMS